MVDEVEGSVQKLIEKNQWFHDVLTNARTQGAGATKFEPRGPRPINELDRQAVERVLVEFPDGNQEDAIARIMFYDAGRPIFYEDNGEIPDAERVENRWNQREEAAQILVVFDARDAKVNAALDRRLLEFKGRPDLKQLYGMIWASQGATKQDFKYETIASEWGTSKNNLTRRKLVESQVISQWVFFLRKMRSVRR